MIVNPSVLLRGVFIMFIKPSDYMVLFFRAAHIRSFQQSTVTIPIKILLNLEVLLI